MNIIAQCLIEHVREMRTFGAVAVIILAVVIQLIYGIAEPLLGLLYLLRDFRKVGDAQRGAVFFNEVLEGNVVKVQPVVFDFESILWKIEGLADQVEICILQC